MNDRDIEQLIARVQKLEQINIVDGQEVKLTGTTHETVNTKLKFKHTLGRTPTRWYPIKGYIYVKDLDDQFLDIRSPNTSEYFEIILR